ncbi:MAG: O-antigen ligase family protein [Clostridiales bacterium]|nr:O-antigen ligase family protein [Clostridiales bacterium]
MSRFISMEEAGDYQADIRFAHPLDTGAGEISISISGQNRQEMLRGHWTPYLVADLSAYEGQTEVALPFSLPEKGAYLNIQIVCTPNMHSGDVNTANTNAATSITISVVSDENRTPDGSRSSEGSLPQEKSTGKPIKVSLSRYLIPESMIQGVETFLYPKTMYDRFGFYLDGFRVFLDYPLTGVGGSGWRYIYGSYQKHPYIANDLHSYAMQLIVEYGICGALVLLALVVSMAALLIRCMKHRNAAGITGSFDAKNPEEDVVLLLIGGTLLAHSMIDVDFTFFGQMVLFAICFTLITGKHRGEAARSTGGQTKVDQESYLGGIGKKSAFLYLRDVFAVLFLLFACVTALRFGRAYSYAIMNQRYAAEGDADYALASITRAISLDPTKPEYKTVASLQILRKGYLFEDEYALTQRLTAEASEQGQFSTATLSMLADYYLSLGLFDDAWSINGRIIELEPYLDEFWNARGRMVDRILQRFGGEGSESAQDHRHGGDLAPEYGPVPEYSSEESPDSGPNGSLNGSLNGSPEDIPNEMDEETLAALREAQRFWLERGLNIPNEMLIQSAELWVPVVPGEELSELLHTWREQLATLDVGLNP